MPNRGGHDGHELRLVERETGHRGKLSVTPIDERRLKRAKAAYTLRRVSLDKASTLVRGDVRPHAGDLVLARVDAVRQHARLELTSGRRAHLHPGDEIVVAYGNRYAPDQFHSVVPEALGPCCLVAAGGVASAVLSRHGQMKPATQISPIGLVGDASGEPLNVSDFALGARASIGTRARTTVVAGTSMNSGKTTTAAFLIRGLVAAGMRVGAAKITGTGAGGDRWRMLDAGAETVLDFVDAGFSSTYCVAACDIEQILMTLTDHLYGEGVDEVVLELADGLYQTETAQLLSSATFRQRVDNVIFSAGDSMSAVAGARWLRERDLPLRLVSGGITLSPLASSEAQGHLPVPVVAAERLCEAHTAAAVVVPAERREHVVPSATPIDVGSRARFSNHAGWRSEPGPEAA